MLFWNRSYSSFNWSDSANHSLVLVALFRLETHHTINFSSCFLSCPAFCPLQIITAASNNTSPTRCVPAGRGRGICKRKKNSLCHQEFYWTQIDFTTLRWTAVSSWFRQLSVYWRPRKANVIMTAQGRMVVGVNLSHSSVCLSFSFDFSCMSLQWRQIWDLPCSLNARYGRKTH